MNKKILNNSNTYRVACKFSCVKSFIWNKQIKNKATKRTGAEMPIDKRTKEII